VAKIRTLAAANQYLRERFLPDYNATFGRAPADPTSAFVPIGRVDLDQILCHEEERLLPATTPSASTASSCRSTSSAAGGATTRVPRRH